MRSAVGTKYYGCKIHHLPSTLPLHTTVIYLWAAFFAEGLLRFGFKNEVLKPYHAVFNHSRGSFTQENNLIILFTKYCQIT